MVLSCLVKQTTNWELPHDLLVTFAIGLVTFCYMRSSNWHLLMPLDHFKNFNMDFLTTLWLPATSIGVLVILTSPENK